MTEEDKKKPCRKAISLQEAINAMQALQDEDIETYGVWIPECFDGKRAIEALKQLKPVGLTEKAEQEPKTDWIPVSERLPESSGVYIVSRWFTDGFDEMILTDSCYFDGTSTWHNDNRINHGREYVDKKIVAWQPLPKPYKAESEG